MHSSTHPVGTLSPCLYVVCLAVYKGRWLLVRNRSRDTWETAGGHIEPGETPLEAARRELYEETGALRFTMMPAFDYRAEDAVSGANGRVFWVEVEELGPLPAHEVAEVALFDELPPRLTYPQITPLLMEYGLAWRAQGHFGKTTGGKNP